MNKNQNGFSATWFFLVLVVMAIVGLIGWRVLDRRTEQWPTDRIETPQKPKNDDFSEAETWLTYANKEAGITFQYPESWTNTVDNKMIDNGKLTGLSGSIISPQGSELLWKYIDPLHGGGGGYCPANPGDQPFAEGNNCGTKQILSVEKIPNIEAPDSVPFSAFKDRLFITRTKYMPPDSNGETTYQICLDSYYVRDETPRESIKIDDLLFPCDFWRNGFNVKFEVENETAFSSSEAILAERIMRSFNSL